MLLHFKKSNEILETWSPHCKNLAFKDPSSLNFHNRTDASVKALSQILYGQYHIWELCIWELYVLDLKTKVFVGTRTRYIFPQTRDSQCQKFLPNLSAQAQKFRIFEKKHSLGVRSLWYISKIKNVEYISRNCMRVQNDLGPIMPATSSQCYAVCSTSCGMYYNLCWELLAKWAINQLQLCLLVQCTFAIQYVLDVADKYLIFSFLFFIYPNSFMVDYIPRGMATIHNKAISQVL